MAKRRKKAAKRKLRKKLRKKLRRKEENSLVFFLIDYASHGACVGSVFFYSAIASSEISSDTGLASTF